MHDDIVYNNYNMNIMLYNYYVMLLLLNIGISYRYQPLSASVIGILAKCCIGAPLISTISLKTQNGVHKPSPWRIETVRWLCVTSEGTYCSK